MITDYENENENKEQEDGTSFKTKSFVTHYYSVFYQGKNTLVLTRMIVMWIVHYSETERPSYECVYL